MGKIFDVQSIHKYQQYKKISLERGMRWTHVFLKWVPILLKGICKSIHHHFSLGNVSQNGQELSGQTSEKDIHQKTWKQSGCGEKEISILWWIRRTNLLVRSLWKKLDRDFIKLRIHVPSWLYDPTSMLSISRTQKH